MRRLSILTLSLVLLSILMLSSLAAAAKTPVSAKKPTRPPVRGTTQLPGDNCKFGMTYTMGKNHPFNITLLNGDYSAVPLTLKDTVITLKEGEKLFLLRFTVQNPQSREWTFNGFTFKFTAIDSENVNRPGTGQMIKEEDGSVYNLGLKPAQKIAVLTAFKIPAKVTVPKIMVEFHEGPPVLRAYPTKNDIKPLPAPYADPADASGLTLRDVIPADINAFYPTNIFAIKVTGVSYQADPIGNMRPDKGDLLCVVNITVQNRLSRPWTFNGFTYRFKLKTSDGETEERSSLMKAQRPESAGLSLEPGAEYTARVVFKLPVGVTATGLEAREGESNRFVWSLPVP